MNYLLQLLSPNLSELDTLFQRRHQSSWTYSLLTMTRVSSAILIASHVVPFGLGPRRCSGEPIARLELLLFFTTILQQCTIEEAPGCPIDLDNYYMGLAITHLPFKAIFRSRNGDWWNTQLSSIIISNLSFLVIMLFPIHVSLVH